MKQCPECHEAFDDQEAFCDLDGSTLIDQTDSLRDALTQANPPQASTSGWVTGAIGGFVGVLICVLLYVLFLAPDRHKDSDLDRRGSQARGTPPAGSSQLALAPAPRTSSAPATEAATPTEEEPEAASPSPTPTPATTPAAPAPSVTLNNGPIATGGKRAGEGERAIIKMKDGSLVEADAAWEDSQGVWFRRSGVVSFVEKSRVEAITEPTQRRPSVPEVKAP